MAIFRTRICETDLSKRDFSDVRSVLGAAICMLPLPYKAAILTSSRFSHPPSNVTMYVTTSNLVWTLPLNTLTTNVPII